LRVSPKNGDAERVGFSDLLLNIFRPSGAGIGAVAGGWDFDREDRRTLGSTTVLKRPADLQGFSFFVQKADNFLCQFHQSIRIRFLGCEFAEFHPPLYVVLHALPLPSPVNR
jgi:hypothetical protein